METTCTYCGHDVRLDGCTHAQDENGNIISCDHCVMYLAGIMGLRGNIEDGGKDPIRTDDRRIYA